MTETTETAAPPFNDNYAAPIVYFDVAAAHGIMNGAIQIEVVSRILVPLEGAGVRLEWMTTGRLRCSPSAAQSLITSLQQSLEMLNAPQQPTAVSTSKLN